MCISSRRYHQQTVLLGHTIMGDVHMPRLQRCVWHAQSRTCAKTEPCGCLAPRAYASSVQEPVGESAL